MRKCTQENHLSIIDTPIHRAHGSKIDNDILCPLILDLPLLYTVFLNGWYLLRQRLPKASSDLKPKLMKGIPKWITKIWLIFQRYEEASRTPWRVIRSKDVVRCIIDWTNIYITQYITPAYDLLLSHNSWREQVFPVLLISWFPILIFFRFDGNSIKIATLKAAKPEQ